MPRRVLITGLGAVTGFGVGIVPLWGALLAGRSCLGRITRFDASGFRCGLGAEIPPGFSAKDFLPKYYRKAVKVMARDIEIAVAAAKVAVENAGLVTRMALPEDEHALATGMTYRPERMGCQIGAGMIAAEMDELTAAFATARSDDGGAAGGGVDLRLWGASGMDNLTPLWLLKYLPNMLACHVTIIHGAEGPSNTITCSEASGLLSLGESMRVIERGSADLCFSGGAESKINPMGVIRQDLAGRLAPSGDHTEGSSLVRPYDEGTQGTLLGEGGGILILEEAASASARGANAYAEVAGFGAGASLPWYGQNGPDEGYVGALESALEDAGIRADQVDALAPLASGVREVDAAESGALRAVFGSRIGRIPMITLCGQVGNTMAGAGGLQAAVGAMCLREQLLPARLHAGTPGELNAGASPAMEKRMEHVLVCTGSLGGQNAAMVLRRI
ncbi:MAG: hypothetical protein H7Y88_03530 [Phycisphaerales bacterium]|nr:hypothetical protein [Phycisphaerales bacterium]